MKFNLTLNRIREHFPRTDGWEKLLKHLGKTSADDEPVPLLTVLDSNGPGDANWCLRCFDREDERAAMVSLACDFAEAVLPIFEAKFTGDNRPRAAIEAARKGDKATADAVEAAAWAAAYAARAPRTGHTGHMGHTGPPGRVGRRRGRRCRMGRRKCRHRCRRCHRTGRTGRTGRRRGRRGRRVGRTATGGRCHMARLCGGRRMDRRRGLMGRTGRRGRRCQPVPPRHRSGRSQMTRRAALIEAGKLLYGIRWVSPLARNLGVTRKTVHRWPSGERGMPDIGPELSRLLGARWDAILEVVRQWGAVPRENGGHLGVIGRRHSGPLNTGASRVPARC